MPLCIRFIPLSRETHHEEHHITLPTFARLWPLLPSDVPTENKEGRLLAMQWRSMVRQHSEQGRPDKSKVLQVRRRPMRKHMICVFNPATVAESLDQPARRDVDGKPSPAKWFQIYDMAVEDEIEAHRYSADADLISHIDPRVGVVKVQKCRYCVVYRCQQKLFCGRGAMARSSVLMRVVLAYFVSRFSREP